LYRNEIKSVDLFKSLNNGAHRHTGSMKIKQAKANEVDRIHHAKRAFSIFTLPLKYHLETDTSTATT
jgi:hypothetical protein